MRELLLLLAKRETDKVGEGVGGHRNQLILIIVSSIVRLDKMLIAYPLYHVVTYVFYIYFPSSLFIVLKFNIYDDES